MLQYCVTPVDILAQQYYLEGDYTPFFSTSRALGAITNCYQSGLLFHLSEEIQCKCAAFFLATSADSYSDPFIPQDSVNKLLADWKQSSI